MKIAVISLGALLQFLSLYVAFYSDIPGKIYFATLISVVAMGCILVLRHWVAPVCLLAGILIGLSLSHNSSDLQLLSALEDQVVAWWQQQAGDQNAQAPSYVETTTPVTHLDVSALEPKVVKSSE